MSVAPPISPASLNDAARGLAQQMVFWGHDVRHPGGNALVRFGMSRTPSPGLTGTSCYSMPWENGRIELHGAVASWSPNAVGNGCIFSRDRARIDLWKWDRPPIPGREYGTHAPLADRWLAFQPLLRWLIAYEEWVDQTLGTEWRGACWGPSSVCRRENPGCHPRSRSSGGGSLPPRIRRAPRSFSGSNCDFWQLSGNGSR